MCCASTRRSTPNGRHGSARRSDGRTKPPADAVAALIAGLGLPGTLRDVGVKPEQLDEIAAGSMHDRWVHTNPRKIDGPPAVRTLLDAAW